MEFIIEVLLELIFEGSIEISSNRKVSKWIRYPLILFIIMLFTSVILGLLIIGVLLFSENIYASLFMIFISLVMLVASIIKFKKIYIEKKEEMVD